MQALPQIYDGVTFTEPDKSGLSAEAIARLDAVRSAFGELKQAEQAVAAAQADVTAAEQAVAEAERIVKPFGEYGFHRLWQQHVKGI